MEVYTGGNPVNSGNPFQIGVVGNATVVGTAVDGAVAVGNPVQIGGKVRTAVDITYIANDAQALTQTSDMQVLVKPYGLPEADWSFQSAAIIVATAVVLSAGAASVRNYITAIQYHNTSATPSEIQILDGSTVIWRGYAPATMAYPASIAFPTPLKASIAAALNVQLVTTATNTYVNAQGYKAL